MLYCDFRKSDIPIRDDLISYNNIDIMLCIGAFYYSQLSIAT